MFLSRDGDVFTAKLGKDSFVPWAGDSLRGSSAPCVHYLGTFCLDGGAEALSLACVTTHRDLALLTICVLDSSGTVRGKHLLDREVLLGNVQTEKGRFAADFTISLTSAVTTDPSKPRSAQRAVGQHVHGNNVLYRVNNECFLVTLPQWESSEAAWVLRAPGRHGCERVPIVGMDASLVPPPVATKLQVNVSGYSCGVAADAILFFPYRVDMDPPLPLITLRITSVLLVALHAMTAVVPALPDLLRLEPATAVESKEMESSFVNTEELLETKHRCFWRYANRCSGLESDMEKWLEQLELAVAAVRRLEMTAAQRHELLKNGITRAEGSVEGLLVRSQQMRDALEDVLSARYGNRDVERIKQNLKDIARKLNELNTLTSASKQHIPPGS
jgi:hypothetical protein